jgi:hypothetical protein
MELRASAHRRKRYGDIGSPCLIPREGVIFLVGTPLIRIKKLAVLTHIIIRLIHLRSKPKFSITASKKLHSTQSYTLLISILTAIKPVLPYIF